MATDAVRAVASIAAGRHSVLMRKLAVSSGLSPRSIRTAIRAGWLDEPAPGVLVVAGSVPTWRRNVAVVLAASRDKALTSHRASATLFGLDGFDDPDAGCRVLEEVPDGTESLGPVEPDPWIDVLVEQPFNFNLPAGLRAKVHQTDRLDLDVDRVVIDDLPCTGLARTLCDVGSVCSEAAVWKALISARRKYDLSPHWLAQTAQRLDRPGPTGSATIRRLLRRWANEGALPESWLEELMGLMLRDPEIPEIVRQFTIRDQQGAFVGRVDAAIPAARVAFEGHSRAFHFGPINEAADEDRDLRIGAAGFEVVYLGWYATKSPVTVLETIKTIVRNRLALFEGRRP